MRPRRCGAASDGWMLYVRVHPLIGCCKLCFKCGCSCVDHPGWGRVDESTCVRGNYTALNTHMSDYAVQLAHESQANLNQLGCEVCRTGGGIFQRHALLQPLTRSRVCVAPGRVLLHVGGHGGIAVLRHCGPVQERHCPRYPWYPVTG